jgi:hypothetical protein
MFQIVPFTYTACTATARALENKLVSIGPRFSFLGGGNDLGKEKLDPAARRELKSAERSLAAVGGEIHTSLAHFALASTQRCCIF